MTKEMIDKFTSKNPPTFKPDLETKERAVRDCDCIMCGERKAELVIDNPNGELLGENDDWYWEVCKECSEFVQWNLGKTMDMVFDMTMRDIDKAKKDCRSCIEEIG